MPSGTSMAGNASCSETVRRRSSSKRATSAGATDAATGPSPYSSSRYCSDERRATSAVLGQRFTRTGVDLVGNYLCVCAHLLAARRE